MVIAETHFKHTCSNRMQRILSPTNSIRIYTFDYMPPHVATYMFKNNKQKQHARKYPYIIPLWGVKGSQPGCTRVTVLPRGDIGGLRRAPAILQGQ